MSEIELFSMDSNTPYNIQLSGYYKRSFAYYTVKERLPVILTRVIDGLVREKESIVKKYGHSSENELKELIGKISKLKYEIQTNKKLELLKKSSEPDIEHWNRYLLERSSIEGNCTYFNTIFLYSECYMYRKLWHFFQNTVSFKEFDPFRTQKQNAFDSSINAISAAGDHFLKLINNCSENINVNEEFITLLKLNLWSNKCDLSLSLGADSSQTTNPLSSLLQNDANILVDDSQKVWNIISRHHGSNIIDIVLDNAGYELFTDFCLADYIISRNLGKTVRFYVKKMPWYVSDVTQYDFHWVIDSLISQSDQNLSIIGKRWKNYVESNHWTLEVELFWTLPFDFSLMKSEDDALYSKLSEAKIIFFKGDLNYRKLLGEVNWEPTTSFDKALQEFHPTNICTLRTVKADLICGLVKGMQESLDKEDPDWMTTGNWAVIQCFQFM